MSVRLNRRGTAVRSGKGDLNKITLVAEFVEAT